MNLLTKFKVFLIKIKYRNSPLPTEEIMRLQSIMQKSYKEIRDGFYIMGQHGDNEFSGQYGPYEIFVGGMEKRKLTVRIFTMNPEVDVHLHVTLETDTMKVKKNINGDIADWFIRKLLKLDVFS